MSLVKSIHDNQISIYKNVLINNGVATAYFVMEPFNYGIMDIHAASNHVQQQYKVLELLYNEIPEAKISIFKLKNIISKKETLKMIENTIKSYSPEYKKMPDEYKALIKLTEIDYTIISFNIDLKDSVDIETESAISVAKHYISSMLDKLLSMNTISLNEELLDIQLKNLNNLIRTIAYPVDSKIVMNIFVNSIFPSYNLIYTNYLINNSEAILGNVKQEIIPHLGWFELSNSGIVGFGGIPKTTYGSIIRILNLPDQILSGSFNISYSGVSLNMQLIPRDKAIMQLKRIRSSLKSEDKESRDTSSYQDNNLLEELDEANYAIRDIDKKKRIPTAVDLNLLIIADTKEELDQKKKTLISQLSKSRIVSSIAPDQGASFVNSFIKRRPMSYDHLMDLEYALSFQIDKGVRLGDFDSKYYAPPIGDSDRLGIPISK